MTDFSIDYQTATLNIPETAPQTWKNSKGLAQFYSSPNNDAWGKSLSRVLYHESLHFWQILSLGYVTKLVEQDWNRFINFEKAGAILPYTNFESNHKVKKKAEPFSTYKLLECLTRFWDVHTRGPNRIIIEEKIDLHESQLYITDSVGRYRGYTGKAYDTIMQVGEDCQLYADPYRWMLKKSKGNSFFVQLVLPVIASLSFNVLEPVNFFCKCFDAALNSKLSLETSGKNFPNINKAWLSNWNFIISEIVNPILNRIILIL